MGRISSDEIHRQHILASWTRTYREFHLAWVGNCSEKLHDFTLKKWQTNNILRFEPFSPAICCCCCLQLYANVHQWIAFDLIYFGMFSFCERRTHMFAVLLIDFGGCNRRWFVLTEVNCTRRFYQSEFAKKGFRACRKKSAGSCAV